MKNENLDIMSVVNRLTDHKFDFLSHSTKMHVPMPSVEKLEILVEKLKSVLFPGFFGNSDISKNALSFYLGSTIDEIYKILKEQIRSGYCFECGFDELRCNNCELVADEKAKSFINKLPDIKALLSTDVVAAYNGDPAAKNYGETIFCYPSLIL